MAHLLPVPSKTQHTESPDAGIYLFSESVRAMGKHQGEGLLLWVPQDLPALALPLHVAALRGMP